MANLTFIPNHTKLNPCLNGDFNERKENLEEILKIIFRNLAKKRKAREFVYELAYGVRDNLAAIDEIIIRHATEWPMEQIPPVDRNVLRLGIFELMFLKRSSS